MKGRTRVVAVNLLCFMFISYFLILFLANFFGQNQQKYCPTRSVLNTNLSAVDCRKLFESDVDELCKWGEYGKEMKIDNRRRSVETMESCRWAQEDGWRKTNPSHEETGFPIAYTIMAHKDPDQVEYLLRLLYRPQNLYCIHLDANSSNSTKESLQILVDCLPNAFLSSRAEKIYWVLKLAIHIQKGSHALLRGAMNCARDLAITTQNWTYLINLSAQDVPLKTNLGIVRYLKRRARN